MYVCIYKPVLLSVASPVTLPPYLWSPPAPASTSRSSPPAPRVGGGCQHLLGNISMCSITVILRNE